MAALLALFFAAATWLPSVHWLFVRPQRDFNSNEPSIAPKAQQLAARHLQLWTNATLRRAELDRMRRSNAEWDFMGRSFLVWALAETGLPARPRVT